MWATRLPGILDVLWYALGLVLRSSGPAPVVEVALGHGLALGRVRLCSRVLGTRAECWRVACPEFGLFYVPWCAVVWRAQAARS